VEQAYATLSLWPALGLRAGIFLVPFGNPQEHFPAGRDVVTRPLVSYVVTPSDWTDNGVGLVGRHLVGASWLIGYEAWVMAGLDDEFDALGLRAARQGYGVDNNADKALVGRVSLKRGSALAFGLSGYRGRYDDGGRRTLAGWGADLSAGWGPLSVAGEIQGFAADRAPLPDARYRGFYMRTGYAFGGRALARTVLGRGFDAPRLALVAEVDQVTIDGPGARGAGAYARAAGHRRAQLPPGLALGSEAGVRMERHHEPHAGQGRSGRDRGLGRVRVLERRRARS
jgi:hypothetical protein